MRCLPPVPRAAALRRRRSLITTRLPSLARREEGVNLERRLLRATCEIIEERAQALTLATLRLPHLFSLQTARAASTRRQQQKKHQ